MLASAIPAINPNADRAVSIWQQGAGRVDAYRAVYGQYDGAANQGLDIQADLDGVQHFGGNTRWDPEADQFFLVNEEGHAWSETFVWSGGHAWSEVFVWNEGHAWSEAIIWSGGHAWSEVFVWSDGHAWSEAILVWIEGHAWSEALLEWITGQLSIQTGNWNDWPITLVDWVPEE